jgi:hypothetical protein
MIIYLSCHTRTTLQGKEKKQQPKTQRKGWKSTPRSGGRRFECACVCVERREKREEHKSKRERIGKGGG